MEYTPAENLENGKARTKKNYRCMKEYLMMNKKVITRRLVVNRPIVNVDEQRIGQNNLDHGTDKSPQDRKLYNWRCRKLNIALKYKNHIGRPTLTSTSN